MKSRWQDVSRIVCVRLDNLGDVLMTTPAIRALRESLAAAAPGRTPQVTLLGSAAGCEVGRLVPEIDAVIPYDAPWVAAGRDATLRSDIASRLAAHRFDAAVIFTCYSQSALPAAMLCAQAGIPLRLAHCRENPYGLLTDWVRDPEPDGVIRHEVERQLALVDAVGATTADDRLSLAVDAASRSRATAVLDTHGIEDGYVVLHPGATAASRRWPAERFGLVAAALRAATGRQVLVTGSSAERDLTARVVATAAVDGVHDLGGVLPLAAMVATIADAALLVSNNSGPVHIAAACQTPVVDLYALTNPQHTPWRVPHRVLSHDVPCRNCQKSVCPEGHHRCLLGVDVDRAVAAALALLGVGVGIDDAGAVPFHIDHGPSRATAALPFTVSTFPC